MGNDRTMADSRLYVFIEQLRITKFFEENAHIPELVGEGTCDPQREHEFTALVINCCPLRQNQGRD